MNISTKSIVSNSEMIKNYKDCRSKAEDLGKIFVLKNNQPDAVLFSINEYERISGFLEYLESLQEEDVIKLAESLQKAGIVKNSSIDQMINAILHVLGAETASE